MERNLYMKNLFFNIQLFNDDAQDQGPEQDQEQDQGFTQEQLNEILAKRLAKERAKWEKDFNTKLEKEKAEAQRLATMDAEQRKQEELNKRIQELEERENQIKLHEKRMETLKVLKERGLNDAFVDFVIGADDETTFANINALEKAFKDAVKLEVDKRLPSHTPNAGSEQESGQMTKEQFRALPLSKQNELYKQNPEVYKKYF